MSGLSVNSVSSYTPSYSAQTGSSAGNNFQNLGQAIQAGNLSAARAAFAAFQKTYSPQTSMTSSGSTSPVGSTGSLSHALNSGNMAAAQAAYADLKRDIQLDSSAPHIRPKRKSSGQT